MLRVTSDTFRVFKNIYIRPLSIELLNVKKYQQITKIHQDIHGHVLAES